MFASNTSIVVRQIGQPDRQVFKPYRNDYSLQNNSKFRITGINYIADYPKRRYWGWYGDSELLGAISDKVSAGFRFRINNIMIGDSTIAENIFKEIATSNSRFNDYFIGEIHLNPEFVTPNSRGDNFKDSDEWREIQQDIRFNVFYDLSELIRQESGVRNKGEEKLISHLNKMNNALIKLIDAGFPNYNTKINKLRLLKIQKKKVQSAISGECKEEHKTVLLEIVKSIEQLEHQIESITQFTNSFPNEERIAEK